MLIGIARRIERFPMARPFARAVQLFAGGANNMAAVEEKLKQIIVEQLGVDEAEVTSSASFVDDLFADSLTSSNS